jgi:predicted lipoprotein with Yx(FWY)xxD motif
MEYVMRKSGWAAAAAGLVSAALLLTACGGSSSSNAGAGSSSTPSTNAAATGTPAPKASGDVSSPPPGARYFIVQKSAAGWVLAEATGQVVYTYAGDSVGKAPTCNCDSTWPSVTGTGLVSPADNMPGVTFTSIGGVIAYNGMPLYTFAGAKPLSVHEGGQWKLIKMSESDVKS